MKYAILIVTLLFESVDTSMTYVKEVPWAACIFTQFGIASLNLVFLSFDLAVRKDILQHCLNQSDYIMTAILDEKDHLFTDYLISIQFRWSSLSLVSI